MLKMKLRKTSFGYLKRQEYAIIQILTDYTSPNLRNLNIASTFWGKTCASDF